MFFFCGEGRWKELVDYDYKSKGVFTHLLVDNGGNLIAFETISSKGDERQQVEGLFNSVNHLLVIFFKETGLFPIFEADKGYDSLELRGKAS